MISSNWDKDGGWKRPRKYKEEMVKKKEVVNGIEFYYIQDAWGWWKKKKSSTKREIKDPFSEAEITYDLTVCWCRGVIR